MHVLIATMLIFASAAGPLQDYGTHGGMERMTCPIGGERFEALVTNHYSTFGARPDGKPLSYWFVPLPLPECPSNGFVVFDDFTPEQIAALTPLVGSAEYRTMVGRDSTYYRAQWLATRIGMPEREALWMLLVATWQVKPQTAPTGQPMPSPEKAEQYQQEFVARVRALPPQPEDEEYLLLYLRAANAERELGRFDSARAMLGQLDEWTDDPDKEAFATGLAAVIEREDRSEEPLDMLDHDHAASLCLEGLVPETEFNQAFCGRSDIRERMEEIRRARVDGPRL